MKPSKTQRKVTLTTITATDIYHLVEQFTRDRPRRKTTRGRNPLYPEALILTLALLQVAQRATYRQLLFDLAPHLFPNQPLPALGTLLYRFQTLPEARWHELLTWLAERGIALEQPAKPLEKPLVLVDGTGWGYDTNRVSRVHALPPSVRFPPLREGNRVGHALSVPPVCRGNLQEGVIDCVGFYELWLCDWYDTPFYAQHRRGAEIRKMRSHWKGVVLGYWGGGAVWLVGASLGGAYAHEARLMRDWLVRYGHGCVGSGALWVGDKLYGHQARLLERVEGVGWLPVVWVAPSLRQRVRAKSRLRALARLGEYGWALGERYRIEQVFGSVKGAYGSYIGCRGAAYVVVRVWGQLVLWNMVQYLRVRGGGVFCCVWVVVVL
jgi:hypothetical protein